MPEAQSSPDIDSAIAKGKQVGDNLRAQVELELIERAKKALGPIHKTSNIDEPSKQVMESRSWKAGHG
jgi:hypothetical protein